MGNRISNLEKLNYEKNSISSIYCTLNFGCIEYYIVFILDINNVSHINHFQDYYDVATSFNIC